MVDGNNLIHGLAGAGCDVDRMGLCRLLEALVAAGERVRVVFDGQPPGPLDHSIDSAGVAVEFSGRRSADELIMADIAADSAPRRLVVVSSDWEIRRAARKRRCRMATSEEFSPRLLALARRRAAGPPAPAEPEEKRHGLTEEQSRKWMEEFGFES